MASNTDLEREYYLSLLPGDLSDLSTADLERAYYLWALDGGGGGGGGGDNVVTIDTTQTITGPKTFDTQLTQFTYTSGEETHAVIVNANAPGLIFLGDGGLVGVGFLAPSELTGFFTIHLPNADGTVALAESTIPTGGDDVEVDFSLVRSKAEIAGWDEGVVLSDEVVGSGYEEAILTIANGDVEVKSSHGFGIDTLTGDHLLSVDSEAVRAHVPLVLPTISSIPVDFPYIGGVAFLWNEDHDPGVPIYYGGGNTWYTFDGTIVT